MTPVKLLTLSLLTINLSPIHGTDFNKQFVSTEHFIDKSLMLKEFFQRDRRVFITAPSGFGKTTNLKMMKKFCQMESDSNYTKSISWNETNAYDIFKNLKVFEHENIVSKHLAQHPVIFLDLKLDIEAGKEATDENIWQKYKLMLINAISEYELLISHLIKLRAESDHEKNASKIDDFHHELGVLSRIVKGEFADAKYTNDTDRVIFRDCVGFLGKILHGYYKNSVVLLIDNYDYIVHNSFLDSNGQLYTVGELLRDNIMQIIKKNARQIMYIMITSVTTMGYQSFGFEKYFTGYYFFDDHPYTSHFGLIQQEIDNFLEKLNRDGSNSSLIKQACNGYETRLRYLSVYNTSCAIEYLKNPTPDTQIPYRTVAEPNNFIVKLFQEPEYLDQVCKLIKECPTRHGSHEFVSFDHFSQLVKDNFNEPRFTSGLNATAFSILVQQGFLGPIRGRYAFHIPNNLVRRQFIENMQYFYEKVINIDLKLIGSYLYDIFGSIKANLTAKPDLSEYLTKAFAQLKPFNISADIKNTNAANRTKRTKPPKNQTTSPEFQSISITKTQPFANPLEASQKFVHQSIIHLGALTNPNLKVIEDYPLPISHEKSTANVDRRCVTCINHDNIALIVKNTDRADFKVAEERARKYYKYSQPGIDHVWYLTVHVDGRKQVSSSVTKNIIVPVGNGSRKRNKKKKAKAQITTILPLETTIGLEW